MVNGEFVPPAIRLPTGRVSVLLPEVMATRGNAGALLAPGI